MRKIKFSLIVTTFNEEKNVGELIDSISIQSRIPDEIVIVDGESKDGTISIIKEKILLYRKKLNIKLIKKKGNRSVGRNEAIKNSTGDIILSTDAGCILDKNWVENITQPFKTEKTDVVSGYYKGVSKNVFQKSLIPYVLVMEDKITNEFLPATRSMAFKKSVWEKVGRFNESLSHNEDYAFALKIKKSKYLIKFKKDALVFWMPRKNLKDAFIMFFRFALGDIQANIIRSKIIFIFLRYIFALYLTILNLIMKSFPLVVFTELLFLFYILWSIYKNYKYVSSYKAFLYLPLLQFTSDIAVISGTSLGLIGKINLKFFFNLAKKNKIAVIIIAIYSVIEIIFLSHGIPSNNHPFAYFMDEWHQSQAVRNVFQYGTPNIPGSANGSMLQFFLTGLYLIPFYLLGIVNPFAIESSVTQLFMQHNLFLILRFNTLIFGVLSIFLMLYVAKKYYKLNTALTAFIFTINPLFIILSGYFKYDIALLFWILLSFLFILKFSSNPSFINYILVGFFSALSLSTKLSAIPLLPIYLIAFFLFYSKLKEWPKFIGSGLLIYLLTFLFFGIPDLIIGKGNIVEYLQSNLVRTPAEVSYNYNLGMHYLPFLISKIYPVPFGHFLYLVFIVSTILFIIYSIKRNFLGKILFIDFRLKHSSYIILSLLFLFFAVSLYPLRLGASGNRVLVLLPFVVITAVLGIKFIYDKMKSLLLKYLFIVVVIILGLFQAFETFSWIHLRLSTDPRIKSSEWILKDIPPESKIGIENIPIYQLLPDVVIKEFYLHQYGKDTNNKFRYEVINSKSINLPKTIVLSNDEIEGKYVKKSDKKDLVVRLKKESYGKAAEFKPDFKYFNILNSEFDFYMSGFAISPNSISVFSKN